MRHIRLGRIAGAATALVSMTASGARAEPANPAEADARIAKLEAALQDLQAQLASLKAERAAATGSVNGPTSAATARAPGAPVAEIDAKRPNRDTDFGPTTPTSAASASIICAIRTST